MEQRSMSRWRGGEMEKGRRGITAAEGKVMERRAKRVDSGCNEGKRVETEATVK